MHRISDESFENALRAAFAAICAAVALLSIYFAVLWLRLTFQSNPAELFSPLDLVLHNLKLLFQGRGGYFRTLHGLAAYAGMAAFFFGAGAWILRWLAPAAAEEPNAAARAAFAFLIGSWAASVLWLGLGLLGWARLAAAVACWAAGVLLCAFDARRARALTAAPGAAEPASAVSAAERLLAGGLVLFVFLTVAIRLPPSANTGSMIMHFPVADLFVREGRVFYWPYQIHTLFSLNTEMLILWAYALKSDVAAALLNWGFWAAAVALCYGFVRDLSSRRMALLAVALWIAAPIVTWYSTVAKNDLPTGAFLFAHYAALCYAFRGGSRRWALIAGILCGGAVGHKLNAVIPAFTTTCALLAHDALAWRRRRRGEPAALLSGVWLLGLAAASGPWLLRSFVIAGNPVYPFLNRFFGGKFLEPWHAWIAADATQIATTAGQYVMNLIGLVRGPDGAFDPGHFGPALLFAALALPLLFDGRFGPGERWSAACAAAGCLLSARVYMDSRYQIGFFVFLIAAPFALYGRKFLDAGAQLWRRWLVAGAALAGMWINFINSRLPDMLVTSWSFALSGFGAGHYVLEPHYNRAVNPSLDGLSFMHHLIRTRTQPGENVLPVKLSSHFSYGSERRMFYTSDVDKQIIQHLAEQASDEDDLKERLLRFEGMGVRHILLASAAESRSIWQQTGLPGMEFKEEDLLKMQRFFKKHTDFRASTADGNIVWLTIRRRGERLPPVELREEDAREFPIQTYEYAESALGRGDYVQSMRILEMLAAQPLLPKPRRTVRNSLMQVYGLLGLDPVQAQLRAMSFGIAGWHPAAAESFPGGKQADR